MKVYTSKYGTYNVLYKTNNIIDLPDNIKLEKINKLILKISIEPNFTPYRIEEKEAIKLGLSSYIVWIKNKGYNDNTE